MRYHEISCGTTPNISDNNFELEKLYTLCPLKFFDVKEIFELEKFELKNETRINKITNVRDYTNFRVREKFELRKFELERFDCITCAEYYSGFHIL